jgi:RNA polymerase sigma factor (sigma-70 family)
MADSGGGATPGLEATVLRAKAGDRDAIHDLVLALQEDLFGLSLRMLANREEAEDATQEILVRIITRLATFDGRSSVRTWAYRVAVNTILDARKSAAERLRLSFERLAEGLSEIPSQDGPQESEHSLLIEEVKVGCSLGMLQCLDRPHRLAFILGELLETPGPEAAGILGIPPHLFRKRLQMARSSILGFTRSYCGLVSDEAPCRCNRRVPAGLQADRLRAEDCKLATKQTSFD